MLRVFVALVIGHSQEHVGPSPISEVVPVGCHLFQWRQKVDQASGVVRSGADLLGPFHAIGPQCVFASLVIFIAGFAGR